MCTRTIRRKFGSFCKAFLRSLDITASRAMGCFISCIRGDRADRPVSQGALGSRKGVSSPFLPTEDSLCEETVDFSLGAALTDKELKDKVALRSQSQVSSPFSSQDLPCKETKVFSFGSALIERDLEDQANFLKACGTIPETPPEIRRGSEKSKSCGIDSGHSIHLILNKTSQLDEYSDQSSSPVKCCEERGMDADSPCLSPSRISIGSSDSNSTETIKTADNTLIPVSTWISETNIKCRSKSVRFACDDATLSSSSSTVYDGKDPKTFGTPLNQSVFKLSPNRTPLDLSDEMQTPGTVYFSALENSVNDNVRVRSQHVCSVPYPASPSIVLEDLDPNSQHLTAELGEHSIQLDSVTQGSKGGFEVPPNQKKLVVDSLMFSSRKPSFGRTPGDRPIFGNVATYWNDYETNNEAPKCWDGNGIPNSTRKYKEDQKVTWHATPFEERLEKALSDKIPISQRKPVTGTAILFEENEENEMEPSSKLEENKMELRQSHSGTHPEPAVSC